MSEQLYDNQDILQTNFHEEENKFLTWKSDAQLVGIQFYIQPPKEIKLNPNYSAFLHAWLLKQVGKTNADLATQMHDFQSEKGFSVSRIQGLSKSLKANPQTTYTWQVNGFSSSFVNWLHQWIKTTPSIIQIYDQNWKITTSEIVLPASTYSNLWSQSQAKKTALRFLSPTSFRRHGHHVPIPIPTSLFNSYLRRWNIFAHRTFDSDSFLDWIDRHVLIQKHILQSVRTTSGKRGLFTGFIGTIEFGLDKSACKNSDYITLFHALCRFAPYCGTGHKTTFGLGFTRYGWTDHLE